MNIYEQFGRAMITIAETQEVLRHLDSILKSLKSGETTLAQLALTESGWVINPPRNKPRKVSANGE